MAQNLDEKEHFQIAEEKIEKRIFGRCFYVCCLHDFLFLYEIVNIDLRRNSNQAIRKN